MTIGSFILKNALRNKRRALLSILSVAASLFLFVTLLVALRELTMPQAGAGAAMRIVVRNKVSIANFIPARQRPTIAAIPGVEAVSPFSWFGGVYKGEKQMTFAQFAIDPKMLEPIFSEATMTPGEYAAFQTNRTSCIIGKITADRYKLKVGDHLPLTSMIYPCSVDLTIAGIYHGSADDRNVLFHHDYLDKISESEGWVGTWWVKARTAEDVGPVVQAINDAFANSSSPVRAETERAFQLGFISMWGNIKMLVNSISTVVVFTLLLVSMSTMSMAVRERFRELAVLKALGFQRREIFLFILAESFGLALAGAFVGVGAAYFLFTYGGISNMTNGVFLTFEVTPKIMAEAGVVATVLGIIASIAPSISVARMSVVDGLKTLD